MKLSASTSIVALLLLSLGAACGDDDVGNGNAGGGNADGGKTDGGKTDGGKTDGGNIGDGGGSITDGGDGGDSADVIARDTGTPTAPFSVDLGAAGNFVILSKAGISTNPPSTITGDIGVSPGAASLITGFDPIAKDGTNTFGTSAQVLGKVFASDYAPPTPANLTTAVGNMETAFTDAAGRAPKVTELGQGDIGGMTLTAGVHKWSSGLLVPTNVTLTGSATDVWIFQIAQGLTVSSGTKVLLTGGAVATNVYWQVTGAVVLNTTSEFNGIILGKTSIAVKTGAKVTGRLFAQTAVTLEGNIVKAN